MFYISHRGNVNGPVVDEENSPNLVLETLANNYDVEVDVWLHKNKFYLGHDEPQYLIEHDFLLNEKLWCHAKNIKALEHLLYIGAHCFWHQEDKATLTSKGYIWTFPGGELTSCSICVLPEIKNVKVDNCLGICSDYISSYRR